MRVPVLRLTAWPPNPPWKYDDTGTLSPTSVNTLRHAVSAVLFTQYSAILMPLRLTVTRWRSLPTVRGGNGNVTETALHRTRLRFVRIKFFANEILCKQGRRSAPVLAFP